MQQRKHTRLRCTHAEPAAPHRRKTVAEQINSIEEIPDRRARRPIRETPDKNKSARCLSDRFRSIRRALVNCKKCGICYSITRPRRAESRGCRLVKDREEC